MGRLLPHALPLPRRILDHRLRHLCDKDHSPITREQGGQYLAEDLLDALRDVERLAPNLKDEPDHRASPAPRGS